MAEQEPLQDWVQLSSLGLMYKKHNASTTRTNQLKSYGSPEENDAHALLIVSLKDCQAVIYQRLSMFADNSEWYKDILIVPIQSSSIFLAQLCPVRESLDPWR